jgi:hypothetical protein
MKKILLIATAVALGFTVTRCNSSSSGTGGAVSLPQLSGSVYSTTSNVGDYAEWSFASGVLTTLWYKVSSAGAVDGVISLTANCGAEDGTYAFRTCTIATASCQQGTCGTLPSVGVDTFKMLEVTGVALFVKTGNGVGSQLHVGVLRDNSGCSANVAGDYVYIKTNVANRDLFGMYRTDSALNVINHSDFGFSNPGSAAATPTLTYNTQGGTGAGNDTLVGSACSSGVRTRTLSGATLRSMMTSGGLFILDLPSGQGGLVSYKTTSAATLADLASKNFKGISFPDNGTEQAVQITTSAVVGSAVAFTGGTSGGPIGITSANFKALSNTTNTATAPAFPDFTAAVTNYSNNITLQPTYSTVAAIPGLFRIEGTYSDTGRVIVAFMNSGGKTIGFGAVYNYRTAGMSKPDGSTYSSNGIYNTGNFLLFEK